MVYTSKLNLLISTIIAFLLLSACGSSDSGSPVKKDVAVSISSETTTSAEVLYEEPDRYLAFSYAERGTRVYYLLDTELNLIMIFNNRGDNAGKRNYKYEGSLQDGEITWV